MLNMGGPQKIEQVHDYLLGIMTDRDMIQLPFQRLVCAVCICENGAQINKKKYKTIIAANLDRG